MKHPFYLLIALVAAAASCTAPVLPSGETMPANAESIEQGYARLNVTLSSTFTKDSTTPSEGGEATVDLIDILVFNENGGLDCYRHNDAPGEALSTSGISVPHGSKTIAAVVNAPASAQLERITSLEALRAVTSHFGAENSGSRFVMYGEASAVLVSGELSEVSVTVHRLAARVRIDKITRNFGASQPALQALDADGFCVSRLFLANVADDVNLYAPLTDWSSTFPAENSTWRTSLEGLSEDKVVIDQDAKIYTVAQENALSQGSAYEQAHRLYAYPNTSDSQLTRLVIEVLIDGSYYTYPIEIASLHSNYSYEIRNLTITRLGNPSNGDEWLDPDECLDPISIQEFDVSLVVSPWNLVLLGDDGDIVI